MKYKTFILSIIFIFIPLTIYLTSSSHAELALQEHADWDVSLFNPGKPALNDDVILPMPCGGKMAFRKVETVSDIATDGIFGDHKIRLGDASKFDDIYKINPVNAYISGGFTDKGKDRHYLLVAKYEITNIQYDVIMKEATAKCPEPEENSALPKSAVNWFDAIEFTKKYTLWLQQYSLQNTAIPLPKKDNEMGFVRLPTEVEWEYAVRGGSAVSTTEFEQSTFFPTDEPANQFAWYSNESGTGKPHKIGKLKPNPLGLYDALGNVEEIVFDLFHLSHQRAEHHHGETGGYVVRGGSYLDDIGKIYTARRNEISFFREGKLHPGAETTGFRVVVSAPVLTMSSDQLAQDWQKLSTSSVLAVEEKPDSQPFATVQTIKQETQDINLKNKMDDLLSELNDQKRKYEEQLSRAAREALRTASNLCQDLNYYNQRLKDGIKISENLNLKCEQQPTGENKIRCDKIKDNKVRYDFNKQRYAESVNNLSDFRLDIVKSQKDQLIQYYQDKGFSEINPYLEIVNSHVAQYVKSNKKMETDDWNKSCTDVKTQP